MRVGEDHPQGRDNRVEALLISEAALKHLKTWALNTSHVTMDTLGGRVHTME